MGLVISLILNLVAPNLIQPVCDAILSNLPTDLTAGPGAPCICTTSFDGIFDLVGSLETSCNLTFDDKSCVLKMGGSGSAMTLLSGGSGSLSVTTEACDIGVGNADFQASGNFLTDGTLSLTSCSAAVTGLESDLSCDCGTIGCEGGLSAVLACEYNSEVIVNQCLDFTEVAGQLEEALEQNSE